MKDLNMINTYSQHMINFQVITDKENKPLKRRDIYIIIDHPREPTPKKDDLIKLIAEKFNGNPENIELWIFTEKGRARTKVKSYIWKEKKVKKEKEEKKNESEGESS
ncbi:MAG: hypothetical protein QXY45_03245 [Candidatus Aenigmatarchaeota archaeon]